MDVELLNKGKNYSYLNLIEKWRLKNLNNGDIILVYEVWLFGRRNKRKPVKTTNYRYNELIKGVTQEIKEILISKFWKNAQSSNYPQHLI